MFLQGLCMNTTISAVDGMEVLWNGLFNLNGKF